MDSICDRNWSEIDAVLDLAKLNRSDLLPTSQVLYFNSANVYDNSFKLLQLDPHLLDKIQEGHEIQVKGEVTDNVVICSEDKTFDVHEAETSNVLLLAKSINFFSDIKDTIDKTINSVMVSQMFYEYLETTPGKPSLHKLTELLSRAVYKGEEHEHEVIQSGLLTFHELNNIVQVSKTELETALKSMDVVTINGKIRLLDFEYHFRVLSFMLKLIDENSWSFDEINYNETVNALKDFIPADVVNSLFDKYLEESQIIDDTQLYSYKESKVCKFFAKVLLHDAGKFNLSEFLQAWHESVPEGMTPSEEMLYEIAVIDKNSTPNVIWALDECTLPDNINERFKVLFSIKEKWSIPEIAPFIKRLTTDKMDVNAILAKYARASNMNGIKYYSSKHAK